MVIYCSYLTVSWVLIDKLDWFPVQAYPAVLQVVARTSNRIFVGLPLCALLNIFRVHNFSKRSVCF